MAEHYDIGSESDSTEDMVANINKFNDTNKRCDVEVISMDVKALYPSLNIKEVASTIARIYQEGEFAIEGVDWEEATKYIAMVLTPDEIERLGFSEIVQERKHKRGRAPGITTPEVRQYLNSAVPEERSVFKKPKRIPNREEKKRVMAKCIEIMTIACMSNHMYNFDS